MPGVLVGREIKRVTIYAGGYCIGNPGPGGYGVVLAFQGRRKEIKGGFAVTTHNRMELQAVIAGLEALRERCRVTVQTDSHYVAEAMRQGWARRWRAKGWWRRHDEPALNVDLWERLLALCETHQVEFVWLSGPAVAGKENYICQTLARQAAVALNLPPDPGYKPRLVSDRFVGYQTTFDFEQPGLPV